MEIHRKKQLNLIIINFNRVFQGKKKSKTNKELTY